MAFFVRLRNRQAIDRSGTDGAALCCWCYKVSRDGGRQFAKGEIWGLDVPIGGDVQDAKRKYTICNDTSPGCKRVDDRGFRISEPDRPADGSRPRTILPSSLVFGLALAAVCTGVPSRPSAPRRAE